MCQWNAMSILTAWLALILPVPAFADEQANVPTEAADTPPIEQLIKVARRSVAVVQYTNREGEKDGLGTGFVIDPDGLIATNLHVIGHARPIQVRLADGSRLTVTAVHASDHTLDLCILRVDAKDLPALPLGDSGSLVQGQSIVVLGNPLGLEHSAVQGMVSAVRDIGSREMIQLAIPVEPGNSGGPVIAAGGQVVGIVTLKSAITANLGFAVPINQLKALIERPNPVPIERWLTIGAIDIDHWEPLFGAQWRQRAGRIVVENRGDGFGGRSLLLSKHAPPQRPFEMAVTVRMDDEAGAAGLIFGSDGQQKHYGFYPSAGNLRLSRFDGPNILQWNVLKQVASKHYRPGDWNTLKVRFEKQRMLCFVNDQLVIESTDDLYPEGGVGLVKFRHTRAQFRNYKVGANLPPSRPSQEAMAEITRRLEHLPNGELPTELIDALVVQPSSRTVLIEKARALQQRTRQFHRLAEAVHRRQLQQELAKHLQEPDDRIDLFYASLLIAKMDNPEVDVAAYRRELDRMAARLSEGIAPEADDQAKLTALNRYLFEANGFHGSRTNYYHRSNSYMNEVLDDREGLPLTLSVLYAELGNRIGLHLVGASLPGHFVVRHIPPGSNPKSTDNVQLIDVFEGGRKLSRQEAAEIVFHSTREPMQNAHLQPAPKKSIVIRMLRNLMGVAQKDNPDEGPLPYLDAMLAISPDDAEQRWLRALLRARSGLPRAATEDTTWLLEKQRPGVDLEAVRRLHEAMK